ncbi:membrane protein [Streptomyces sp. NRRL B-1140]|nr:membrane protein [Streptomyces sp. NRRL B-1140]
MADETEGFLLAHSHRDQAQQEAEELCARMPWLTTAQVEEITGHYVRRRLDVTRQLMLGTVRRADELRQEYESRYIRLRRALLRRHAAGACAVLACAAGAGALAGVLTR